MSTQDKDSPFISACPVGCAAPLLPSAINLPEGPLLRCAGCGQLVSQCSEAQHAAALAKWDTAAGTRPDARSEQRHEDVSRRRLATLLRLLGRAAPGTRLLDVGCSSGAFLRRPALRRSGWECWGTG